MNNKAVLYTRVSSDEQRKSGFSLAYQEKQGKEYAEKNGLEIVCLFSESYTAKKPGRPKFNEMLHFVKKHKIQNLIFLKSDRASRNGVDSAALVYMAERDIFSIHLIQDGLCLNRNSKPTDFLIFEINNCFSNFYPRNLSVDVSTKMREKAEQGYYPSIAPIGYTNQRIKHRSYIQINPEKAPFVKKIFELYSTGQYSYSSLAKKMREDGFIISDKVGCYKSNIEDILNNPIYMGDFIWKGKRYYDAKHEPIVSRELFAACQNIIKSRSNTSATKRDFIFSNMIHCSHCGCFLVGELKKQKYVYYHCTGNRGGDCKRKSYIREEKIEEKILEIFNSFKLSPETLEIAKRCLKSEYESQHYYNEARLKKLEEELEKNKQKLNKLFDLYLEGEVEEKLYKKKRGELEEKVEDLSMRYSIYNKTGLDLLKKSEFLLELCEKASLLYSGGDINEKRNLIKIVCSNFYYDGENLTITIKKAFQPIVKIALLENMECKRRNSNFVLLIKDFIKELETPETSELLEQIYSLKKCA